MRSLRPVAAVLAAIGIVIAGARRPEAQSRVFVSPAAAAVYARLLPEIARIRIFDHHAHPGFAGDAEVDPAPVPPSELPLRLRPDNPDWTAAAHALFGFPFADLAGAHGKWLADRKAAFRRGHPGPQYFDAILDTLGIETSMANRITMSPDLDPARFKWVFYIDAVMYPFDNSGLAARNPDEAAFMPAETSLVQRFERQAGLTALPASFGDYLSFVDRTIADHRRRGAVALKFEAAYFRPLAFGDPAREQAAAIYDKYRAGGVPSAAEYRTFQDFVFRHVVLEAGRVGLPVHIHSSAGSGDYFNLSGVNVLNLEPVLRDPRYARTTFVLIHGGYPFDRQAIFLALMKHVWIDSSATGSFVLYPDQFKDVLRRWFEIAPEKVTYGSDAFPIDDTIGAEELYWFGVHGARIAAAAALAEMVAAHEITEPAALAIARGVPPRQRRGALPRVTTTRRRSSAVSWASAISSSSMSSRASASAGSRRPRRPAPARSSSG